MRRMTEAERLTARAVAGILERMRVPPDKRSRAQQFLRRHILAALLDFDAGADRRPDFSRN